MKQKVISLILATALLLSALLLSATACGSSEGDTNDTNPKGIDSVSDSTSEDEGILHGLQITDFGGRDFNILIRDIIADEYSIEAPNGDVLNDACYKRNRYVEENLNLRLNYIVKPGSWGAEQDAYQTVIRSSVMSGSQDYDAVELYAACANSSIADRLFLNLHEIDTLRLDRKWWCTGAVNELTVNNTLYTATGDIALNFWNGLWVAFYNKRVAEENQIAPLYSEVKNGTWTIDKFRALIAGVSRDLDGNGTMNEKDIWGAYCGNDVAINNMQFAFDIKLTEKKPDGSIALNVNTEKFSDACDLVYSLIHENEDFRFSNGGNAAFTEGRSLFTLQQLKFADQLRDMNDDFGILPYPKYDEAQEGYFTTSSDGRSMYAIPIDVRSPEESGLGLEALCVATHDTVIPEYYDVALRSKYTRDPESNEMLDIIRDGVYIDFVVEYTFDLNSAGNIMRQIASSGVKFSSKWAEIEGSVNELFDRLLAYYS